jgi:DNA topoisomerase-3
VIVVVAEKPSVARDLARVLGARERGEGALFGGGYAVTWAIGHLVQLCSPEQIEPRWRGWRFDTLPMIPERFPLEVVEQTRAQFEVVRRLLCAPSTREVVCATDAGREGELIFRHIAELCELRAPVRRLWISSLTDEAIREGFRKLQPGSSFDGLADAARGRSRADWLVGMNLSRAYTLAARARQADGREVFSVGRVQTPTLAMIVERDRQIRDFVPEEYLEVVIEARAADAPEGALLAARYVESHAETEPYRIKGDPERAAALVARAKLGAARVHTVEREEKRARPPLLYDLTELQRHASRLYGFSASRTLELAQRLYEEHKLLSYPRTDSRHLSSDLEKELPAIVAAVAEPYRQLLEEGTGQRALGKRFVDDSQVKDHHAIIPTGKPARLAPGSDEFKLYDLVVRRLLQAYQSDYRWALTTLRVEIAQREPGEPLDRYFTTGTTVLDEGHRRLDVKLRRERDKPAEAESALPVLSVGQALLVQEARSEEKRTRPPPHHSEASLLTAMETAGRQLEDRELEQAMRERGLGTPATRAATIETLIARGYVERAEKKLTATPKGEALIDSVHPHVKSPIMTGEWEHKLRLIERARGELASFMREIEQYVREVVGTLAGPGGAPGMRSQADAGRGEAPQREQSAAAALRDRAGATGNRAAVERAASVRVEASERSASAPSAAHQRALRAGLTPEALLKQCFGFETFRAHQREVVEQLIAGRDVLLVMPTGAGKSLCYQLPGIARGGTTLVVSPLIALMDDQASKLQAQGLRAERIHSGLARESAREVCRRYLRGELDFLFIAPERLRVPGFPELLERRPPSLIAIDEAHCISHWGHDFRPDYRMLSDRLPRKTPVPLVALTATATPEVQRDILEQLAMRNPLRSIHGFRRDNLSVQVVDALPSTRERMAQALLAQPGRLPAIVYAPTRSRADEIAQGLSRHFRALAYHAGMDGAARERVQSGFLAGDVDIIVATIAFGMGIDKPDVRTVLHLGSPATVEGYYQEIGRAGRDGKPSLALLLCSVGDRRMHEFFFERDYPPSSELARVYDQLSEEAQFKGSLARKLGLDDEALERVLDKLWANGGAHIDYEDRVVRGTDAFVRNYPKQRASRAALLAAMGRFVQSTCCRMVTLVHHFGDSEDDGKPCGSCDRCQPDQCAITPEPFTQHASTRTSRDTRASARVARRRRPRAEPIDARGSAREQNPDAPEKLVAALKSFRREEAKARSVPAFHVLSDRALYALAQERPQSEAELRAIQGVGPAVAKRYGGQLLQILRDAP